MMEDREFDELAKQSQRGPTRRSLVHGVAALLGALGLGVGLAPDAGAKKSKKQKRRERKQQQQQRKNKNRNYECDYKDRVCAASTNPCVAISCQEHTCVSANVADGVSCGNGLACAAGVCACPGGTCVVKVSAADLGGWAFFDEATNAEIAPSFAFGPDEPPFGSGSARLKIDSDPEKKMVSARILNGVKLADLSELSYWTYVQSATGNTAPHFQIGITRDIDNPLNGFESRLAFAPNPSAVTPGVWQQWDLLKPGNSQPWFFVGKGEHPSVPFCTQIARCTFEEVLLHYPNIAVNPVGPSPANEGAGWGFMGVMVGSYEGAVNSYADGVTVAVAGSGTRTIYNFELDA